MRSVPLVVSVLASFALAAPAAAVVLPIPQQSRPAATPDFIGDPAEPKPIFSPNPPRHPFMAPNGRSNLHEDAFQTDVHQGRAPLGRGMTVRSNFLEGVCASITFDSRDRLITVCVGVEGPKLYMLDPRTLEQQAFYGLPGRQPAGTGTGLFTDFAGGGYFILDERDRALIPTTTRHLLVVAAGKSGFSLERDHDLTGVVTGGDKIISALPDWSGRPWFASVDGVVGYVGPSGKVSSRALGEPIANSFAVDDENSVYMVTTKALYRLEAGAEGPRIVWRQEYETTGVQKPGQASPGSGTTPTLFGDGLVAITDGSDPIRVNVYRRGRESSGSRLVCSTPVFEQGSSATDQSLIATNRSLVVENNHGYAGPSSTQLGRLTTPGLERVDIDRDGRGCRRVWRSEEVAPTAVPKLSTSTGLVYTYTKTGATSDPWYLTAIDFETGRTVFKAYAGQGLGLNNNYAPITFGPDGTVYVGVLGGIVSLRDAEVPGRFEPRAPRVSLRLRRTRAGLRANIGGEDAGEVERVEFMVGRRSQSSDARPPFTRLIRQRGLRRGRSHRVVARIRMLDGRGLERSRRFRRR